MSYYFTKSSRKDLKDIWHYTDKKWGEAQADKYLKGISTVCQEISKHPTIGRLLYGISTDIRVYRYHKHYIFYLDSKKSVRIIAVLHEKMDLLKRIPWRI